MSSTLISDQSHFNLDLSSVVASLDNYPNGTSFTSDTFKIHDLSIYFVIYPQGMDNTTLNKCSIFCKIETSDLNKPDKREVDMFVGCGSKLRYFVQSIHKLKDPGWGFPSLCKTDHFVKNPLIHIRLKIFFDPLYIHYPLTSLDNQQQKMYKLSKKYGDIKLIIKDKNNENDNDNYLGNDPPRKKRKLNNNNNNNNGNMDNYKELGKIKVNSLLLRSSSKVFDNILKNNMIEKKKRTITIFAKSVDDVDNMIYFVATNQLRKDCNASNIIRLAHLYSMNRLFYECINRLLKEINIDNLVETVNIFDRYEIKEGYQQLVQFTKKNVDKLKEKNQFMRLSHCFRCSSFPDDD